jgi:putative FmdB family regulatory protein
MPIYEFRCSDCDERFEALCKVGSNGRRLRCPHCRGGHLERLMSGFFASGGAKSESSGASSSACSTCSSRNCSTCH